MVDGYSGKAAAEIVGITYRQLDYWARTDLVRPTLADACGSGSRRKYGYRDLLELKLVKTMLDSGIKLESVRDAFAYLRSEGTDISAARLVIAEGSATLVRGDAEMIDVINRVHGQGVLNLNLVTLDGMKGQVDAAVLELRRPEAEAEAAARADVASAASR